VNDGSGDNGNDDDDDDDHDDTTLVQHSESVAAAAAAAAVAANHTEQHLEAQIADLQQYAILLATLELGVWRDFQHVKVWSPTTAFVIILLNV